MAMLSDPGGFAKAAESQAANMKAMGIEATDQKPAAKKEEGPKWGKFDVFLIHANIFATIVFFFYFYRGI